jgi:hypothetical protein
MEVFMQGYAALDGLGITLTINHSNAIRPETQKKILNLLYVRMAYFF